MIDNVEINTVTMTNLTVAVDQEYYENTQCYYTETINNQQNEVDNEIENVDVFQEYYAKFSVVNDNSVKSCVLEAQINKTVNNKVTTSTNKYDE